MRFILALLLILTTFPAFAQEAAPADPDEERSLFVSFIENQLSTPNRIIRIRGIQGVLSTAATIEEITVADREGVWLRISGATIDWSRSTLLLQRRLEISRLAADSIEVLRRPLPAEGLPSPEARSFAVPELPIAINLARMEVPSVSFGQDVFGLQSNLSIEGRLRLEDGALDTALQVVRLDGPGGNLSLDAAYANETRQLELDFALDEPANGVVANLLNIEGRPPLSLTLAGSGPVNELDLSLTLAAAGEPALSGTARFREQQEGLGFTVNVGGPIARLIPMRFRGFFGAETELSATGVAKTGGGLRLESLNLSSAALQLQAQAETASDGFLSRLSLDANIADPAGGQVLLPVAGGETSVRTATLTARLDEGAGEEWTAALNVENLTTGAFSADSATFTAGGIAANLTTPDQRRLTFDADGTLSGIVAKRADVAEALGETIGFTTRGEWQTGEPLSLTTLELTGDHLVATLSGIVSDFAFRGDIALQSSSIAPFSGLVGRDLGGSINLAADGELRPISGAFNLDLDGTVRELRLGLPAADPLLAGDTRITGRLARGVEGITADDFRIANEQMEFSANGTFATSAADFRFDAAITDLALVTPRAGGRLTATGSAQGSTGDLSLSFQAQVPQGQLLDKRLTEGVLGFEGTLQDNALAGRITGDAFLDGVRANLQADVTLANGERRLSGIDFTAGGARLIGDLAQDGDGLFTGELTVDAADISTAATLLLVEAEGAVNARLSLEPRDGEQHASVNAAIRNLVTDRLSLQSGDVEATIADLFGVPAIEGTLQASGLTAAGIDVASLDARAQSSGGATIFSAEANLADGTDISTRGTLAPQNGGFALTLDEAQLQQAGVVARLLQPARLEVVGDAVSFDTVEMDIAGGRLTARGEIAEALDVALTINRVPLSIANTVRPDLALGGTIDGEARVTGTREAPQVSFSLAGREIVAAALRQAGIASLTIDATGATRGETLNVNARLSSPGGLNATVTGDVPLGDGQLALGVDLRSFPLSLLNRPLPDLDLGGTLTGTARVTGSLSAPAATFNAEASGLTARPLASFGAAPLNVTAAGNFAGETLTLETLNATGPAGLSVTASGNVPLAGNGLSIQARGSVPLALANRLLADRGAQIAGTLQADISVGGSIASPVISGTLSTAGATAIDPMTNLRLTAINIDAGISGNTVNIRSGSAAFAGGGTISVSGNVNLDAAGGFPADLMLRLDEARYGDGEMLTATLSGALRLAGSLTRDPLLSGNLSISRAEILVPETFGGAASEINVQHVAPPPAVVETLRRARADDGTPVPGKRPSVLRLDVAIDAPARIFVRGRGLDAELGGSVRLTGPVTSIQPVGGFRLIRGRLSILTQRITFDEGTVTLVGDLDPFLDFVARSSGRDITVYITVSGRVSDLSINFSSQPELPEDEVLARLIFDRGVDELSPLQLAQLAAAAAELAGGANTSLLGAFRNAIGLDDLDIVTDEEGGAAVRAGRYIQENVYLGVEAGAQGNTRATINLDITDNLRARGALGANGDTGVGIFYERDY